MPYVLLIFGKINKTYTLCNTQKHVFLSVNSEVFFAKIYVFFYVFSEKSQP